MPTRINQAVWMEAQQRWQIKVQADGVRRAFVCSAPGRAGQRECHRKADEWLDKRLVDESSHVDMLFDQWISSLKETTSEGHWRQYETIGNAWVKPAFGTKRIGRVNEQDLKDVLAVAYKAGKSQKWITNIRNCMMAFLKYYRGLKCTDLHPEILPIPRNAPAPKKSVVQPKSLKTMFSSTKTMYNRKKVEDWFVYAYRFMVVTGLRPGELIGLERTNIKGGRVCIRGAIDIFNKHTLGKNDNAIRSFILPALARQAWADQQAMLRRAGLVSQYAFPAPDGSPAKTKTLEKRWASYRAHNGIDDVTPYELRHTFVSINKDMPDALKKMIVGHSKDIDTDGVYGHEMDGDQQRAAAMIDEAFKRLLQ